MTDRTEYTPLQAESVEALMRRAAADVMPPEGLHERILEAVSRERRRTRRRILYRRIGVVAAAVLILVPAVTLPLFRQKDAAGAPESADTAVKATQEALLVPTTDAPAGTEEEINTLFSAEEARGDEAPSYASRPAMSTMPTASKAPADAAEPAYLAELQAQYGADAVQEWLSAYEGDPNAPEAEAAARAYLESRASADGDEK